MYICLDCGEIFEKPKHWVETHGLDGPPYEEINGCPVCGGAYAITYKCDGCGRWVCGEYVEISAEHRLYCEHCFALKNIED